MRRIRAILCGLAFAAAASGAEEGRENWPQFRGPAASGVSESGKPPAEWDVAGGRNVLWKTPIPGLAHSSPVVWGDRVFVTTAIPSTGDAQLKLGLYGAGDSAKDMVEHAFKVFCLDRRTGRVLWEQTAHTGVPKVRRHTKATHCNSTPATDGRRLVVSFGSEGLYCYDLDGALRWKKDLGVLDAGPFNAPEMQWGFASSPILADGRVVMQCDVFNNPFLAAFDADDGRELWRTARNEVCTWSTPAVYARGDQRVVVANGYQEMAGYDLATGKRLWWLNDRGGDVPVPTPVVSDDLVYLASAHGARGPIIALHREMEGEFSLPSEGAGSRQVAWWVDGVRVYMQTPLVYRGVLYGCRDNGVLTAFDAQTGEQLFRERVGEGNTGFTASMVAADGRLYVTSEEGDVHVLRAGRTFERIATNTLEETCMATPAISGDLLLFRTRGHVVAIGEKK